MSPDATTIPAHWADVTPAWMTAALQHDHPGVEVASVEVLLCDDGTNRRGKLGLTYASGSGPEVVFVKAEGAHRAAHAKNGNLFNEPELYARRIELPVEHPHPYHVVIDRPALDYVIVMEDVTRRGADPRDATRPMTIAEVENGVRQLAALHSRYWGVDPTVTTEFSWLEDFAATPGWQDALRGGVSAGADQARDLLPTGIARLQAAEMLDLCVRAMGGFVSGPSTLLHADPHIGNTYVLPGDRVGFLDWQVCHRGRWSHDVAYFVVSALDIDDRRSAEHDLLSAYADALDVPGGGRPSDDEMWDQYCAAHAYGLPVWLATYNNGRAQSDEVCRALIERYAVAMEDCETAATLDRLVP